MTYHPHENWDPDEVVTDTLRFVCSECGNIVSVTVYTGEGKGISYSLATAPITVIAEVSTESQHGRIECLTCTCTLALPVRYLVDVLPMSEQVRVEKGWRLKDEDQFE